MKPIKSITAFMLTSLIAMSQYSLGEQNSSVKKVSPNTISNTTAKTTPTKDISVEDFKKDTRHEREFKDALITGIKFPEGDAAHKPENGYSSSSAPARKNNARK